MKTRLIEDQDIEETAKVHAAAFTRQTRSAEWLQNSKNAYPKNLIYIHEINSQVVAYIMWAQKSGFRPEVVLELEQIAVLPSFQKQGIAHKLILESLSQVKSYLNSVDATLKHIVVSTRSDNEAQKLYRKALGAEVEATISNLYSGDEVLMVARHV